MPPKEFRITLTTENFEAAVAFYRDGLGLDPAELEDDDYALKLWSER